MNGEGGQSLYRSGKHWRVGIANDQQPEDKIFDDEGSAIEKAQAMANAYGFNTPIAVWDERDEPLHLFFLDQQFRRV